MTEKGLETGLEQLQQRIDSMLTQAKDNETIQQRCNQLELSLIASNGLSDYLHQMLVALPAAFHLDGISLHLYDPEHLIRHMVKAEGIPKNCRGTLRFHDQDSEILSPARNSRSPLLHSYDEKRHYGLFGTVDILFGSVAVLPLHRGDQFFGMLNLASLDSTRYTPERATDFLQHLAAISAVCLENAINHERLRHIGLTDALTGVRNRRYFEERILDECRAVLRHGRSLACLFLDLDHFKKINDNFGHHNGDLVLQSTARCITQQIRDSDLLSRYGGEEFVLLLLDSDYDEALEIAERIREAVASREIELMDDKSVQVTVSIGVAIIAEKTDMCAEDLALKLVDGADKALYKAKDLGRNCVSIA